MYKNEQAKKGIGEIMSGLSLKYRLLKLILKLIGVKKHFNANERDMIAKARKSMDKTKILLLNKIDNATKDNTYAMIEQKIDEIKAKYTNYQILIISAKTRFNIDELMTLIKDNLAVKTYDCKVLVPYSKMDVSAKLHRNVIVKSEEFVDEGVVMEVILNEKQYNQFKEYIVE